jgi:hypothetical protein
MHEGGALTWREVVEKHHAHLVDELSVRLDSDLRDAVASERSQAEEALRDAVAAERSQAEEARRLHVEVLNQALRRLRTTSENQVLNLLAESCAPYVERLVVLVFENNQARCAARAGIENADLTFDTDSAPAILTAVDSRDPVIALATEAEISPVLARALGAAADSKAYLFPVVARHTVVAMLVASGTPASAPIELLCEAAGMRLEANGLPPRAQAGEAPAPRAWEELGVEDQKLHLQAQRTARVRVAEMRLYHEDQVRDGAARGDIYTALRNEIDAVRDEFLKAYLSKSSTMVDYLHLEILHSLAHDDDRALGHNYPGPMV